MVERTWWECLEGCGDQPVERLRDLMREGRVRRVVVEEDRHAIADFSVTADDSPRAGAVLDAIKRLTASEVDCTIMAELADLEAARVARWQTMTP